MRWVRRTAAALTVLTAAGSAVAATSAPGPYAAPAPAPALSAATLDARFAAAARDIAGARATAVRAGDAERARALSAFLAPGRRFLAFDPRGDGRAVEVFGDLRRADRIAVVVPGADNALANFDSVKFAGGGARALHRRMVAAEPSARIAVVAWLGYRAPSTLGPDVLRDDRAESGARRLGRFLDGLARVNGKAEVALLCHSYGSVVCAEAAPGLAGVRVDDIALFGSPGTTARSAADLRTPATVWAGRSTGDWIRFVPHVRFAGVGFGPDPVSPGFGAVRFDAGTGPHSGYLKPGSAALRNLALIALGRDSEVARA
ncbi:alpha/beta hydrolase [Actinomadura sediminis]|uniref:Alpha/beta hydrolase n=1 Tax=Actinomadura sediminis TaxID=1038904 RepID=A0ABW3EXA7_9ACTN